jgi:hypothetical protein
LSVLPFPTTTPSPVSEHQPWPAERVATLSHRALLARAAELLGLPADQLPLPMPWGPGPAQLAVLRTTAELLLARLELTTGACPDCDRTDASLLCARELGTMEARLAALAHDVRLVLGWVQDSPEE